MIELGLQLLNVCCFHRFQLFLRDGVLYSDGYKLMVVVVFDPPSDCQLCVRNFVLLNLLVLSIATGFPVLQVVLAASNVPESGEPSVQCETYVDNAVSVVMCKGVCFGRNAQSVEQLTRCLHLGAVVVAVEMKIRINVTLACCQTAMLCICFDAPSAASVIVGKMCPACDFLVCVW